jgi:hypothetical protein
MDFTRRRAGEGDIVLIREAATYSPGSMIEVDGIPHEVARDLGDEVAPIAHCAAAVRGREVNGIPPGRRFLEGNRPRSISCRPRFEAIQGLSGLYPGRRATLLRAKQQKYLARTLLSLETAMANKNDFTPEEWTKVLESIIAAGIAVSAADPSGLWGTLKEAAAGSLALAAAKRDPNSNELIKAIADFETSDEGRSSILAMRERFAQAEPTECVQRSLASLREGFRHRRCQGP